VYKDEDGQPYYHNRKTEQRSYRHPSDDFMIAQVKAERARRFNTTAGFSDKAAEPWMDFVDEEGKRYFYNFSTKEMSYSPPSIMFSV